jgi:ABC-type dipeptide/oligopeptide/nickel transport system permease component
VSRGLLLFLSRRLLSALLFVIVVAASTFVLARLAPGDPTSELAMAGADASVIAAERTRLGLDRSLPAHLGAWAAAAARFDLGMSSRFGQPVRGLVLEGAGNTAVLAAVALTLATIVGLPLGLLTGARPSGWLARLVTPLSVALVSCPPIVAALALLLAASKGWLSASQSSLALPALALALPLAATIERLQSQATTDTMGSLDLVAAAARGVPPSRLVWIHAGRQSLRPVLGIYGLLIGGLFSGSLAVEWVTSWPGLGRLTYDALVHRDLFLVSGCALAGAVLIAIGNVAADVIRAAADPRVRA